MTETNRLLTAAQRAHDSAEAAESSGDMVAAEKHRAAAAQLVQAYRQQTVQGRIPEAPEPYTPPARPTTGEAFGAGETFARGLGEGASFGFADEIAGGVNAARALGGQGVVDYFDLAEITPDQFDNLRNVQGTAYTAGRDHSRAKWEDYLEWQQVHGEVKLDWNQLSLFEKEDNTSGSRELACTAGVCEVVDLTAA